MTLLQEAPVVSAPLPAAAQACPSWCTERTSSVHRFAAAGTAHFSAQTVLPNPRPLPHETPALLRAELYQDALGGVHLFVQGETTVDLSHVEADMLIAQAQGFVDTLRVLRSQMA